MKTKSNFMHYTNRGNLSTKTIICHLHQVWLPPRISGNPCFLLHRFDNNKCSFFQGTETMLGVEGLDPALWDSKGWSTFWGDMQHVQALIRKYLVPLIFVGAWKIQFEPHMSRWRFLLVLPQSTDLKTSKWDRHNNSCLELSFQA